MLTTAIKAALTAGLGVMNIYSNEDFEIAFKKDNTPLTKADQLAHKIIEEQLSVTGIPILSEEGKNILYSERKNWSKFWMIDPIDGTKEFIKKNDEFTVNIALIKDARPVMGVIYAPALNLLYFASDGFAYKAINVSSPEWDINLAQKLLPIKNEKKTELKVLTSRSHLNEATEQYLDDLTKKFNTVHTIAVGSSLKLCKIAEGSADCYPRFGITMEWDTAAGQAICEAVGVKVLSIQNNLPLLYNKEKLVNDDFIVWNGIK